MRQVPRRVPQLLATLAILAVAMIAFSVYVGRNAGGSPGVAPTPTPSPIVSAACGSLNFGPPLTPTGGKSTTKDVDITLLRGETTQQIAVPLPEVTAIVEAPVPPAAATGAAPGATGSSTGAPAPPAGTSLPPPIERPKLAPNSVNNLVFLTRNQYYDGLKFHRVVADFVIQGGDPQGTGSGGPGYQFNDEPVLGEYTAGAVAMANSGANTNGSQFFICTVDDSKKLAKSYNLFGYVQTGMDVVLKIAQGDTMTTVTVQEETG